MKTNTILQGDVIQELKKLPAECVDCVITSPPYWGLRDYGVKGQLGLEKTPEEFIANMVRVFAEVKRVLKKDGTLWLNIGDSYATNSRNGWQGKNSKVNSERPAPMQNRKQGPGLKDKDLVLDPFMGAGTTGVVAKKLGRNYVGIELNTEYVALAGRRIKEISAPFL